MSDLLDILNLSKSYGHETLLDIDRFSIPEAACVVLSGRNGAGKSTLLRIIAGLEPPDRGELSFNGKPMDWRQGMRHLQKLSVYLHQHPYMFDHSVEENIAYGLRRAGVKAKDISPRVMQALSWAGLTHLAKKNARRLSGGEKQRVALTRARILSPKLLLLDEPFANMDLESREQTLFYVRRLKQDGISTIVTTHEPYVAQLIGDQHRHLCKTGPCRFTLTEPFLYQRDRQKPAPTVNLHAASPFAVGVDQIPESLYIGKEQITGAILAGGKGRTPGEDDKGLRKYQQRPMVLHVIDALSPQLGSLLINANTQLDRYAEFGHTVITDLQGEFHGPLVGIASALEAATTPYVLTVPCDSPLLPENLAERLTHALVQNDADISVAHDGHRMQPIFALLKRELYRDLKSYLDNGGRKIDTWYAEHKYVVVDFSDHQKAFTNLNTRGKAVELGNIRAEKRPTP